MNSISKFFLCALCFAILISCENDVNPAMKTLRVYEQSSVQTDYALVTSGDDIVFHLRRSAEDDKNAIDDEFSEEFLIQINTQENSFSYSSNSLAIYDLPIAYRQYCFCSGFNHVSMTQFEIIGKRKSNGNWQIDGDVTLSLQYIDEQSLEVINEREWKLNISGLYLKSSRPS